MYSELLKHQLLDDVEKVSRSVLLLELRLDDGYVSMIACRNRLQPLEHHSALLQLGSSMLASTCCRADAD